MAYTYTISYLLVINIDVQQTRILLASEYHRPGLHNCWCCSQIKKENKSVGNANMFRLIIVTVCSRKQFHASQTIRKCPLSSQSNILAGDLSQYQMQIYRTNLVRYVYDVHRQHTT